MRKPDSMPDKILFIFENKTFNTNKIYIQIVLKLNITEKKC